MEKLHVVILAAILVVCGLTLVVVVTREETAVRRPDDESGRFLEGLEDRLSAIEISVDGLSTSIRRELSGRLRTLEKKVSALEPTSASEPDGGISPTAGPRRIEVSRPPDLEGGDR